MRAGHWTGGHYPALVISTLVSTTSRFEALQNSEGQGSYYKVNIVVAILTRKKLNFSLTLIVAAAAARQSPMRR